MAVDESKTKGAQPHPFWDFWGPLLFMFALLLGIRQFLVEARYIPSGSMQPGLKIQDRLLIEKITYKIRPPQRGEIVVFNSPYAFDPVLRSSQNPSPLICGLVSLPLINVIPGLGDRACDAYIKRVVGVAGDRVVVGPSGAVSLNGVPLEEPYVEHFCPLNAQGMSLHCPPLSETVPEGSVLVLGDNRSSSQDSRYWPGTKFLPQQEILGRAVVRFWPPNRIGLLSD